jgi:hypothetical protein
MRMRTLVIAVAAMAVIFSVARYALHVFQDIGRDLR